MSVRRSLLTAAAMALVVSTVVQAQEPVDAPAAGAARAPRPTPAPLVPRGPGDGAYLDPALIGRAPIDSWTTYNGDYSGRRFSTLDQINRSNVKGLTLSWVYRLNTSAAGAIIGGEGPPDTSPGDPSVKSTPLLVDGVLYFSAPDHVWAVDARTGAERWHYWWRPTGGNHLGNRGVGMYKGWLYVLTPDNFLVCLDAQTGRERWRKNYANVRREYAGTVAPVIVGDTVIIATSGDALDIPGYVEGRDPETGDLKWRWATTPRAGEPGIETWPNEEMSAHGGGMAWVPGVYDPELGLYYFGTGNPQPVLVGSVRPGDNLWTASIVALDVKTGKMRWFYQISPHDTHDYDASAPLILIDDVVDGRPRKLLAHAARHGYYFLFDRVTGKHILTEPFAKSMNFSKGLRPNGAPDPDPAKEPQVPGVLVSPSNPGITNWAPHSFSPQTGLLYVGTSETFSMFYLTDLDPKPQGWGAAERGLGSMASELKAIDYRTGKVKWSHPLAYGPNGPMGGQMGILSTAGGLLFSANGAGDFVAYNAVDGAALWRARLGAQTSNGPSTFLLDGKQHVLVAAGDSLYAFALQ